MRCIKPFRKLFKYTLLYGALLLCTLNASAQLSTIPFNKYEPLVNNGGTRNFEVNTSVNVPAISTWNIPLSINSTAPRAIDSDLNNAAVWRSLVTLGSLTSAFLEVYDDQPGGRVVYPGGSYVGFVIEKFGVADLRNKVTVSTYLGSNPTGDSYEVDGAALELSVLSGGMSKVGLVTTTNFDRVRITFNVIGVATSRSVYYAEIVRPGTAPSVDCATSPNQLVPVIQESFPAIVKTGTIGAIDVDLLGGTIGDPGNVIDNNRNNSASLSVSAVGIDVGTGSYISVRNISGAKFSGGTFAGFEISSSSVLQIGLLSGLTISTYKDGNATAIESSTSGSLLASVGALAANQKTTVGFLTSAGAAYDYDEIRIGLTKTVGVSALNSLMVYDAVVRAFCPGSELLCNTLTPINTAQHPVYINPARTGVTGGVGLNLLSNSAGYDNIIDGDANTAATLDLTLNALTSHQVSVASPISTYPKGTFVGFNVGASTFIGVDLLGSMTIRLYQRGNPVPVQEVTGTPLLAGVTTGLLPGLLGGGDGAILPVGVVATTSFDEVQLVINKPVTANPLSTLYIFDFVMQNNCAKAITCSNSTTLITGGNGNYDVYIDGLRTGFSGLVSAVGSINNPGAIIDSDPNNAATISFIGDVGATGSIYIGAGKTEFPKGVFAGFLVKENVGGLSPLVLVNLLKMMRVTLYYRNPDTGVRTTVGSAGTGQLIGLTALLPLLGDDHGTKLVGLVAPDKFNEIEISTQGLAEVGLPRTLEVYGFAIDTRYANGADGGLSCPLFRTNPDINYTVVNRPVSGSVATNDIPSTGNTYSNAVPVKGADNLDNPTGATITLNSNGTYTFLATQPGSYSYDITVTNGANAEVQNLTIIVSDNDPETTNPPIVNTDIAGVKANTGEPGYQGVTIPVKSNDKPGNEGGTLGTPSVPAAGNPGAPAHGTVTITPGGEVVYTPEQGFIGTDIFTYTVCESGASNCGTAYVVVHVTPPGTPPPTGNVVAADDFDKILPGQSSAVNVLLNDSDPLGGTLTVSSFGSLPASVGTLSESGGTITFTPAAGFSGTVAIPYTASAGAGVGRSAQATLYVYVAGLNTLPDNNVGYKGLDIPGNVATNDNPPAGVTYTYGTPVAVGTLPGTPAVFTMNTNGTYTFNSTTPGVYKYSVPVSDGEVDAFELLTITILDPAPPVATPNDPVVMNDAATTQAGSPVTINVKANDKPGNAGNTLGTPSVPGSGTGAPRFGTVTVDGSGNIIYTPNPGFVGQDEFTYTVCEKTPGDEEVKCGSAKVAVKVVPTGTPNAIAADDYFTTAPNVVVSGDVSVNDGPGQTVTSIPSTTDSRGTFSLDAAGNFSFTPAATFTGTAVFEYTTSISGGNSAKASIYVTVGATDVPDLIPTVSVGNATLKISEGTSTRYIFTVNEAAGFPTNNATTPVTVRIFKSVNFDYVFDANATTVGGTSVNNQDWELITNTSGQMVFQLKAGKNISAFSLSRIGVGITVKSAATEGSVTVNNIIINGSGTEVNFDNNSTLRIINITQ